MSTRTVDRARGRWRDILPRLGIPSRYLQNKHGPCPLCGGKDRFRFDDRDGSGSYYCNQCGPGQAPLLLQKLHGWSYAEACGEVDKIIGDAPVQPAQRSAPDHSGRRERLEALLSEATDPDLVSAYLRQRGLNAASESLRGHPGLTYLDGDGKFAGKHPAMLAPVVDLEGSLQSLHRTYLAPVEPRKKIMPPVETISGAAVRLFAPADHLGITEGIETALAAHELFGLPTWAALSANGLEKVKIPAAVTAVTIFGDNDASFAGQAAAYRLAQRLHTEGRRIEVLIPMTVGTDWLDVLTEEGAAA